MNYTDPSGHGIWSKIKSGAKKIVKAVKTGYQEAKTWAKNTWNTVKTGAKNLWQDTKKTISNVVSGGGGSSGGGNIRNYSRQPSTYEKAKSSGQSSYNWFNSKLKEAGNILDSWTKGMEKTVKHFCTTANRIKKDSAAFIKSIDWRKTAAVTQMEYDILMFLHNNPQNNTATEIVKIRKSTKSHVSTSLKTLENKGLVERKQSKENKKHIEIFLLDKAELIVEAGLNVQKEFAKNVLSGMTDEEKHMRVKIFDKICNNAENV